MTVLGISPDPTEKHAFIIAGNPTTQSTGKVQAIALHINAQTLLRKRTGERVSLEVLPLLQAGHTLVVEGKKSKRGVIAVKWMAIQWKATTMMPQLRKSERRAFGAVQNGSRTDGTPSGRQRRERGGCRDASQSALFPGTPLCQKIQQ